MPQLWDQVKCCWRLPLHMARPYEKKVHRWINHLAKVKMEYPEKCVWESTVAHNSHIKSAKTSTKLVPV